MALKESGSSNGKYVRRGRRGSSVSDEGGVVDAVGAIARADPDFEPPNNLDAEQGILASIMLDGTKEVIDSCLSAKVSPDYFYKPQHQKMFAAMVELNKAGTPIDDIVLAEYLSSKNQLDSVGGIDAINEIAGRIETYAHYRQWLDIVREKYFLRAIIRACSQTIYDAQHNHGSIDMFIEGVEEKILGISQDRVGDSIKKASEQVDLAVQQIKRLITSKGELVGVPPGFRDLDIMMRGLHANEMIVIAGRPGTGKTSIALNIAENALFGKNRVPVLVFSLEMLAEQLYMRMIASRARIDQHKLAQGFIEREKLQDISSVAKELSEAPMWIDDTAGISILEMRAKARRLNQQLGGKLGLVIVDYLQLLRGSDPSLPREQEVAEISRGMKAMSKELRAPVVVLAQLNRDSEKETRYPRPSDLRESGSIEQDADAILLLSRQRKSDTDNSDISNSQWLIRAELAKQRNGPTGVVTLLFNRNYTRYENYSPREDVNI